VVRFIKGTWDCGEQRLFADNPLVEFHVMGTGFTWETQSRETDIAAAKSAWANARALLRNASVELVILDELTYMLTYGYLDKAEVLEALRGRPPLQHVVITGRNASRELLEIADTISEVKDVRHAFNHGVQAQKGLDY